MSLHSYVVFAVRAEENPVKVEEVILNDRQMA